MSNKPSQNPSTTGEGGSGVVALGPSNAQCGVYVYVDMVDLTNIYAHCVSDHPESQSKSVNTYSTGLSTLPSTFRLKHATRW